MRENTLSDNWKAWKADWLEFASLIQLEEYPRPYQLAMFRYSIGSEVSRIMEAWDLRDNEPDVLEMIEGFEGYCEDRSYFLFIAVEWLRMVQSSLKAINSCKSDYQITWKRKKINNAFLQDPRFKDYQYRQELIQEAP
ncbi:unnamed protein product [Dicrocoelium dendriticum]|nr:unnamed protein product [Dicrocoelium dendriticum]